MTQVQKSSKKQQGQTKKQQSPSKKQQGQTKKQQSPSKKQQSPSKKQQGPSKKQQGPSKKQLLQTCDTDLETCELPELCKCTLKEGKLLASGGFGKVLKHKNRAFKLIRNSSTCGEAAAEYERMNIMFDAFERAKSFPHLSREVKAALAVIRPIQPIYHWKKSFTHADESFSCAIVASLFHGAKLSEVHSFDKKLPVISADLLKAFPRVMVMVNMEGYGSSLSLMNSEAPLSLVNPPRFFYMSLSDAKTFYAKTFDFDTTYAFNMGVLMAVATLLAKMVLVDIEILLGSPNDSHIYLLDLGMCQPLVSSKASDIANAMLDVGGPFYTKTAIPNDPTKPTWKLFRDGFVQAASDFDLKRDFAEEIMDHVEENI